MLSVSRKSSPKSTAIVVFMVPGFFRACYAGMVCNIGEARRLVYGDIDGLAACHRIDLAVTGCINIRRYPKAVYNRIVRAVIGWIDRLF
jgi:hypothetical protein